MRSYHVFTVLLIIFFLGTSDLRAQVNSDIDWTHAMGGSNLDKAYCVKETSDGGSVIAGISSSSNGDLTSNQGNDDVWIVKLNATGQIEWQQAFGGSSLDFAHSIAQTMDGGFIVIGATMSISGDISYNHGVCDIWVLKLSPSGTLEWEKTYGGTGYDYSLSIEPLANGNYILAGYTSSNNGDVSGNHGSTDGWVACLNPAGTIIWSKTIGGSGNDYFYRITATSDAGFILVGASNSTDNQFSINHGDHDLWIVKLLNDGTLDWQQLYGGTNFESARKIIETTDGGFAVAGTTNSSDGDIQSSSFGLNDFWVLKLDTFGQIVWEKCFGGSGDDEAYAISETTDGSLLVGGSSASNDGDVLNHIDQNDCWLMKVTSSGTFLWEKSFGGSGNDVLTDFCVLNTTGGLFSGYSYSNDHDVQMNHGAGDAWVFKLRDGTLSALTNSGISTLNLFPNPSADRVQIQFGDLSAENLQVLSQHGDLILKVETCGMNYYLLDISQYPPGSYYVIIKTVTGEECTSFLKQ